MTMKVILLQEIKGLGKKFDIKQVKDGYARNFLLPQNLAKVATDRTIKELATQKAAWEKEEQEAKNQLTALAEKLADQEFKFELKSGKKEEVFGSVTRANIKKAVSASISNDNFEINLEKPIKKLGEHQVEIDLGKGVKTKIKIIVESV
jgi:large subunit ribosomal protein L9